jgi:hypothetical protein
MKASGINIIEVRFFRRLHEGAELQITRTELCFNWLEVDSLIANEKHRYDHIEIIDKDKDSKNVSF